MLTFFGNLIRLRQRHTTSGRSGSILGCAGGFRLQFGRGSLMSLNVDFEVTSVSEVLAADLAAIRLLSVVKSVAKKKTLFRTLRKSECLESWPLMEDKASPTGQFLVTHGTLVFFFPTMRVEMGNEGGFKTEAFQADLALNTSKKNFSTLNEWKTNRIVFVLPYRVWCCYECASDAPNPKVSWSAWDSEGRGAIGRYLLIGTWPGIAWNSHKMVNKVIIGCCNTTSAYNGVDGLARSTSVVHMARSTALSSSVLWACPIGNDQTLN